MGGDCFGGLKPNLFSNFEQDDYSRNAYMLTYEKRRKEPIKIFIQESFIVGDEPVNSYENALLRVPDLPNICPQINIDTLKKLKLLFDEESKEHYTLVDFNSVQKFVPNDIYQVNY